MTRDHSFSTYATFTEKLTFLTSCYAHVRISFSENLAYVLNQWFPVVRLSKKPFFLFFLKNRKCKVQMHQGNEKVYQQKETTTLIEKSKSNILLEDSCWWVWSYQKYFLCQYHDLIKNIFLCQYQHNDGTGWLIVSYRCIFGKGSWIRNNIF